MAAKENCHLALGLQAQNKTLLEKTLFLTPLDKFYMRAGVDTRETNFLISLLLESELTLSSIFNNEVSIKMKKHNGYHSSCQEDKLNKEIQNSEEYEKKIKLLLKDFCGKEFKKFEITSTFEEEINTFVIATLNLICKNNTKNSKSLESIFLLQLDNRLRLAVEWLKKNLPEKVEKEKNNDFFEDAFCMIRLLLKDNVNNEKDQKEIEANLCTVFPGSIKRKADEIEEGEIIENTPKKHKILFKKFDDEAKQPAKYSEGAAGFDLYSNERAFLMPQMETSLIKTGIGMQIPKGYCGIINPRSSFSLYGIKAHVGIVDSDYRGEVKVIMESTRKTPYLVKKGERIAQMLITKIEDWQFEKTDKNLPSTQRGTGGFGSTNQK